MAARNEAARQLSAYGHEGAVRGLVTNVPSLRPGQYLASAATAFNIVSTDHVWVQASPKETELTSVEPGQKVTVTVDTYPGQKWTGTVESISPASASEFLAAARERRLHDRMRKLATGSLRAAKASL